MKRFLLAVAGLLIAAYAYAQIEQNSVTGNETWVAAQGPGGPGNWINIDTVRNGRTLKTLSGTGAVATTATGGTLFWIGTAPTSWTVTLPSPAFAGELVALSTDTTLTSMVTVAAGSGQSLDFTYSSATLTAATQAIFQYRNANTTWYRLQ
jgi:hypothetical protein